MQANGPVAWVTMSARATITPRQPRLAALRYAEWSVTFADQNPTEKSRSKAIYTGQHVSVPWPVALPNGSEVKLTSG